MAADFLTPYANSVFEQPWWLDIVAPGQWGEAFVKDGDKVLARLPYVYDRGTIKNPVYTQTLGVWLAPELREFERGNSQLYRQKEVLGQLLDQLPKAREIHITLDHINSYVLPYRWHGFRIEPSFSYRLADLRDMDRHRARFGKTVNKNLRAAEKKLAVECGDNEIETLIDLQRLTYARQNRKPPIDDGLTLKLMERAIEMGFGRLFIARDQDNRAHGAVFLVYDGNCCYYLLSGQDPEFKSDGSQNLLLVKGIEFAATVSRDFDFEGSMIEGIENFFRQFGGEQVINYQISRLSLAGEIAQAMKPRVKKLIGYKN